ncbi:MAG TPA: ABC transporter ATP-binding protein [Casimicrobiaceae bacterium]
MSDPREPVLRLAGITKRFGELVANDGISLDLGRGEVLALLGENGAGKSTLVSILFGHYVADAGSITAFGVPLRAGDPAAALAAGIGMVHQHFTLADNLTVQENIVLGTEPLWSWRAHRAAARTRLVQTAQRFGLRVDPDARAGTLSVGERQRVEILKALYRGVRVLILDEPTSVLTPQETEALFATLSRLVGEGLSIIFISHKLHEVLRVANRIAVLRAGRLVATLDAAAADPAGLAELMVGRSVRQPVPRAHRRGDVVCALSDLHVAGAKHAAALRGVSLRLRAGEVVGIAGVSGNGQDALADVLCGLRAPTSGTVTLAARAMPADPRAWIDACVARIPEDRQAVGVIGDFTVWENAIAEHYRRPFASAGILRRSAARRYARTLVDRFDIRGGGLDTPARALSGGNLQKLILGRALSGGSARPDDFAPVLIVASQPTWGLDVGAVAYVHQRLLDAAARGAAVLLVSDDLDEILALADRIAVMHAGRLTSARPAAEWTRGEIGLAMAGSAATAQAADAA